MINYMDIVSEGLKTIVVLQKDTRLGANPYYISFKISYKTIYIS